MRQLVWSTILLGAVTSCTSSDGDGITPDPTGSASASTTTSSGGQDSGGGGQGGGLAGQNRASNLAWARLQGEFDSIDQEPLNEGGPVPPTPRRLVGCAVDAPELGDRVVYLERSTIEGNEVPDRQLLIAFREDPTVTPLGGSRAFGTIFRPIDPAAWVGSCVFGTTLELRSDVEAGGEDCIFSVTMDEVSAIHLSAPRMPFACMSSSPEATQVIPSIVVYFDQASWGDELLDSDGSAWRDPPTPANPDDGILSYEMARRTPVVESP